MADTILFYISAAQDLEYERDMLARAATEIPVSLGWRIQQTPLRGEATDLALIDCSTPAAIPRDHEECVPDYLGQVASWFGSLATDL